MNSQMPSWIQQPEVEETYQNVNYTTVCYSNQGSKFVNRVQTNREKTQTLISIHTNYDRDETLIFLPKLGGVRCELVPVRKEPEEVANLIYRHDKNTLEGYRTRINRDIDQHLAELGRAYGKTLYQEPELTEGGI